MAERIRRLLSPDLMARFIAFPSQFDRREQHLVAMAVVVGTVVWGAVYLLKLSVHWLLEHVLQTAAQTPFQWFIFVPLVAGSLMVAALAAWRTSYVYYRDKENHLHVLNDVEGDGLERTIGLYYTSEPVLDRALLGTQGVRARWELPTFSLAFRKCATTLVTLGSGGSGGLEGSVTLIGESLAVDLFKPRPRIRPHNLWALRFWRWWRVLDPDELQTAQLSGVAAAVSTLLGAPLAGAFFAVEVMYRRRPVIEKLIYALVASLTAFFLSHIASPTHTKFVSLNGLLPPPLNWHYYLILVVLAISVAFVGVYLRKVRRVLSSFFHTRLTLPWQRHGVGALMTGLIGLTVAWLTQEPLDLVLGTGAHVIAAALNGQLTIWIAAIALIGKLLATMSTITSGGSAGMLVPSMYLGSMAGVIVAQIFGYADFMLVIPSITASLVSLINVPLTAIMLTVELFGASYLLPALIVLLVTLLLSHPTSVYRTQRDQDESREILPSYGVRRINVPPTWEGKTLRDLALRDRYDVNVIGYVENRAQGAQVTPYVSALRPLRTSDRLIVLGKNDAIGALLVDLNTIDTGRISAQLPAPTKGDRADLAG